MLVFAVPAGWNDRLTALLKNDIMQAVRVVGAVGKHLSGGQSPNEIAGWRHVVLLARAEIETHRQTERIDYGMDFGAKTAS